jgi:hypothetical protein
MSERISDNIPLDRPAFLVISNGTQDTAHVTIIRYNGTKASLVTDTAIAPRNLCKLDFKTNDDMKTIENPRDLAGSVTEFGMHIQSDIGVTAYYMHNHPGSRDIFTLKGNQALGTLFYVPMQSDNAALSADPVVGNYQGLDQIDIVATEDDTQVMVVPRASIRIGQSGLSPAGDTILHTLGKGGTLKIMEYSQDEYPSLAGTLITSNHPIAVTVTEDLVAGDTSGDQIVPVNSLGTHYIVPRTFLTNISTRPERFYLVATEDNTEVNVYSAAGTQPITLNKAGDFERYSFPLNANSYVDEAVYVVATKPVYVYQRGGYAEEGSALLPSLYAIGQKRLSFYHMYVAITPPPGNQVVQMGFLIFRAGAENDFTLSYGTEAPSPMTLTPLPIPNTQEWKIARFNFRQAPEEGEVITIQSQSPFSLGYIAGLSLNNDSYGYFSSFSFELPDTTYMCETAASVTLEGGSYAMSYKWRNEEGTLIATTQNVTVSQPGTYTLEMNYDPTIIILTTYVSVVNAGTICPDTLICPGTSPTLSVSGASGDTFQWQTRSDVNAQWTNIPGATLPTYTPAPLNQPAYYRRGTTANQCTMVYSGSMEVQLSRPCVLPVNPHLMIRYSE